MLGFSSHLSLSISVTDHWSRSWLDVGTASRLELLCESRALNANWLLFSFLVISSLLSMGKQRVNMGVAQSACCQLVF